MRLWGRSGGHRDRISLGRKSENGSDGIDAGPGESLEQTWHFGSHRSSSTPPAPAEEALFVKLRAYFECRSRNVDPPPALAEAWDQIYKRYTPQIRAFLRGFNLQEADREDCLQDVWSRVVSGSSYDPKRARALTWLLTMARNRAIDLLRRRRLAASPIPDPNEFLDSHLGPADEIDRVLTEERLRIVLAKLSASVPDLSFRVFYLRTIEGLTTTQVAQALQLNPGQVRLRLHRMRRKLRALLESHVAPRPPDGVERGPKRVKKIPH